MKEKLAAIQNVMAMYGVHFDVWFSEQSLHDSGKVQAAVDYLLEKGYAYRGEDGSILLKAEHREESGKKETIEKWGARKFRGQR